MAWPGESRRGPRTAELLRGTLDVLLLKALSHGSMHGYAIARWIEAATGDALFIEEGSLYPALHRLERRELVEAEWGMSENNRQAKYYKLTAEGRRFLRVETKEWLVFANLVQNVLQAT